MEVKFSKKDMEELENSEVFKLINHILHYCFQIIKVIHAYNKDASNTGMWLLKSEKTTIYLFTPPHHSLDLTTVLTTDDILGVPKLWPMSQNGPTICFWMAHGLRIIFTYLNG